MNDVGQDREFLTFVDVVLTPVVGELVARFLPGHALCNPLVAAPVLLVPREAFRRSPEGGAAVVDDRVVPPLRKSA